MRKKVLARTVHVMAGSVSEDGSMSDDGACEGESVTEDGACEEGSVSEDGACDGWKFEWGRCM